MKYLIITLTSALLVSCSLPSTKNKWANEPHDIKYSKKREMEVWGRVLRGKDPALFYGTPVQRIAEAIVSGENSIIKDELKKLSPKDVNYQEVKFNIPLNKFAIVHGNFEALKILTEHGADPNIPSSNGETAFTTSIGAAQNQGDNRYMIYEIFN